MTKRLLLLKYQIKNCLKTTPVALLVMLITVGIILGVGLLATKFLDNTNNEKINVALVVCDDNVYVDAALAYLFEDEKVKGMCEFVRTDYEQASKMLLKDEVKACVLIPEGFFDGILYGRNVSPQVILKDSGQIVSLSYFQEMITAGSRSLAIAQAAIYAMDDICAKVAPEIYYDAQDYLNRTLFVDVLRRNTIFQMQAVSYNGDVTDIVFYIASAIVTIVLIVMSVCSMLFLVTEEELLRYRLNSIKSYEIVLIKYIGNAVFFTLFFTIVYGVFATITGINNIYGICLVILSSVSLVSLITFLVNLVRKKAEATYFGVICTLLCMVLSGCVVPLSFMPSIVRTVGNILPTRTITLMLANVLQNNSGTFNTFVGIVVWDLFFVIATIFVTKIKEKLSE